MSSRRRGRRGNAKQRLQKQLEIQRELEKELEQLNSAKDQKQCATQIIKFVEQTARDPMTQQDNPFWVQPDPCCCTVL